MEQRKYPKHMLFGLDIGTRSIVGTVGYRENEHNFTVVGLCVKEHDTRAMLDGQIHDINKVAETIAAIKRQLENELSITLTDVCIAAAGRVLKTLTVKAEYEFQSETVVSDVHIHSLDLIAVEKAYTTIRDEEKNGKLNFYCVGYTPIKYYLDEYPMMKLEDHKADKISVDLLATFLPEDVIDGLYRAVEKAGLQVANLTLEPIAAINVAIPEKFRMLNIALVDVGAGTSDICITRDGSIIGYGMIPYAGDELTETIMQRYLVEFAEAEKIKLACVDQKTIAYEDIMGITHNVTTEEVIGCVDNTVSFISKHVSDKIIELNGGKPVSAVFVVGGGGKIPSFVTSLAKNLELDETRVALRGEEVLKEVTILPDNVKKDPLLVTPIGICLNYYEHKNNFIFVQVNNQRIKLYDNSKLTIVDAAMQSGFPNEKLFPRRGKEICYTMNGQKRMVRGEAGEAAIIKLNGRVTGINSPIVANDVIEIIESTIGKDASLRIEELQEFKSSITFLVNNSQVVCPKYVVVNGELKSQYYQIKTNDVVEVLNYYTLGQVLEFMDLPYNDNVKVNNIICDKDERVYENFRIEYQVSSTENVEMPEEVQETTKEKQPVETSTVQSDNITITVTVNDKSVKLQGKQQYIFVDILDVYYFNTTVIGGSALVLKVNQQIAEFTTPIQNNDVIELYWRE